MGISEKTENLAQEKEGFE